jgi:hypothetical protein
MRWLTTAIAYLAALALVAATTFVLVLFVAGPHAGLLPPWAEPVVLGAGWLIVIVVPVYVARTVWCRLGR